jgi:asparagine synthase (glutamine-hydrolysing)
VESCLAHASVTQSGWFDKIRLHESWERYLRGESDNSFYVWQWISVALNHHLIESMKAAHKT